MEFCSNRTVDYSGLEAGVGRAKCRGYYYRELFDNEMSVVAEYINIFVVRNP